MKRTAPDRRGPEIRLRDFKSVLIVKPSSLGDIVHTLPALTALATAHPEARFRWVVRPEWAPLLHGHPHLTDVIVFPRDKFRGPTGYFRASRWGKALGATPRETPELALDFQGLFRSAWIARKRRSHAVAGLSDSREYASWLHDTVYTAPPGVHAVERYLELARQVSGVALPEKVDTHLPVGTWDDRPLPNGPFVALHPWARGDKKSLPAPLIDKLIRELAPLPVVLVGSPPPGQVIQAAWNFASATSLPQLIWLLRQATFVISVDSGPMHLAAALHGRVLGIHTWSDPRLVGPWSPQAHVWKAGLIRPWRDFTDAEAALTLPPDLSDAAPMATFIKNQIPLSP